MQITKVQIDIEKFFELVIQVHEETNHKYDGYIPYSFHLQMAYTIALRYIHLVPEKYRLLALAAVIAHDSIEDARVTYNDLMKMATAAGAHKEDAEIICEMVRAVTNDNRGRNRDERMPDYIYEEIKSTYYAVFVKLCDRLANVNYGLITGGTMPTKYKKENPHFKGKLYTTGQYEDMWTELETLFFKL